MLQFQIFYYAFIVLSIGFQGGARGSHDAKHPACCGRVPDTHPETIQLSRHWPSHTRRGKNLIFYSSRKLYQFVAAGDYLVFKCPTWSWSAGEQSRRRSFLPRDKQLLITRNGIECKIDKFINLIVPSLKGKEVREEAGNDGTGDEFAWISTAVAVTEEEQVLDIDEAHSIHEQLGELALEESSPLESIPNEDGDDVPDVEDFDSTGNVVVIEDPSEFRPTATSKPLSNIVRTRTFDLSITYDKYYQTPRLWLTGYNEHGTALPPSLLFEDISTEHARRTVTIETHPSLGLAMASIHPCRHAHVMRRIVGFMRRDGREVRVDQYLVIFLKFISTVLPNIDYDHTMSLD